MAVRILGRSSSCCSGSGCTEATLVSSSIAAGTGDITITFDISRFLISATQDGHDVYIPQSAPVGTSAKVFVLDTIPVFVGSSLISLVTRDPSRKLGCRQTWNFTVTSGGIIPIPPS